LGSIIAGFYIGLRGIRKFESIVDYLEFGYRFKITPILLAITIATLTARITNCNPQGFTLLLTIAGLSSLYISPLSNTLSRAVLYGLISGFPLTSPLAAVLGGSTPILLESPSGEYGVRLGTLIGLAKPLSRARTLSPRLQISCFIGDAILLPKPRRVLVVGKTSHLPFRENALILQLKPGSIDLSRFDEDLSIASDIIARGGSASIDLGVTDLHLLHASLGVLTDFISNKNITVIVDACEVHSNKLIIEIVETLANIPVLVLRICHIPDERVSTYFSGAWSVRLSCNLYDPDTVRWISRNILSINESRDTTREITLLLQDNYCIASNLYPGFPGIYLPSNTKAS
jgi:hypothetical protein